MNELSKLINNVNNTIAQHTAPLILENLFSWFFFALYMLNLFNFYFLFLNEYFSFLEEYLLNVKYYQKSSFSKSGGPEDGWDPKNFNQNFYISEDEKPLPKKYILPDGRVISSDGDKLSHLELQKRIFYSKIIKSFNNKTIDQSLKFSENFIKPYNIATVVNIKTNYWNNPYGMLELYQKQGIFAKLDTPISPSFKLASSAGYASYISIKDMNNEIFYGIKNPHSEITKCINSGSPFKVTSFCKNDTWDDKIDTNILIINTKKEIKKGLLTNCEIF